MKIVFLLIRCLLLVFIVPSAISLIAAVLLMIATWQSANTNSLSSNAALIGIQAAFLALFVWGYSKVNYRTTPPPIPGSPAFPPQA